MVVGANVHFLGYGTCPCLKHLAVFFLLIFVQLSSVSLEPQRHHLREARRGLHSLGYRRLDLFRPPWILFHLIRQIKILQPLLGNAYPGLQRVFIRGMTFPFLFLFRRRTINCAPQACYHEPTCIPYVIGGVVFYALDHIVRAIKTHITTARLRPLPELKIVRVEVPSLNAGWRAGQHVRLRVLSSSMGWWGWSEVHPFTIANATQTPEGMVLMCKQTGRWTSNLFKMAHTSSYGESGKEAGRDVTVIVEGPYGALSCRQGVHASDYGLHRWRGTHDDVEAFWRIVCCWWEWRLFCIISST